MRIVQFIIDFLVTNATGGAAGPFRFTAEVKDSSASHEYAATDIRGRGTNGPAIALEDFSGSGKCAGKVERNGFPYPTDPRYAVGTLRRILRFDVITQLPTHYIDTPIYIHTIAFDHNTKTGDTWDVEFEWVARGNPSITWGGTQFSISAPSAYDQEVYEGLTKSYDKNGLTTSASQRIYCKMISDSDAAELTKLTNLVAAATAPMTNLKTVNAVLESRLSSTGIFIRINWSLKDSVDDVNIPRTGTTSDPNFLNDRQTKSALWVVGTPPTPPTLPTAPLGGDGNPLKLVSYRDDVLLFDDTRTPSQLVRTWSWGRTDSLDDIQNPKTVSTIDPNDLNSNASAGLVFITASPPSNPTPPSGEKLVDYSDTKLNDQYSVRFYRWAKNDSKDDYELPATFVVTDTHNIASVASGGKIGGTPTTPSGFVLRTSKTSTVKTGHTFTENEFGLRSTADDIEMPNTYEYVDPEGLDSEGQVVKVFTTTGGVPADPTPYTGLQIVGSTVEEINTIESKKTWKEALVNSEQKIEYGASYATRSASSPYIIDVGVVVDSTDTDDTAAATLWASFQSAGNSYGLEVKTITPGKKLVTYRYVNSGILVISTLFSDKRYVIARVDPSSGDVQVWVAQVMTRGSGKSWVRIAPTLINTPVRLITIRRMRTASSVPDFPDQVGTTNGSDFLGIDAGNGYYRGATNSVNITLSGTLNHYIDYNIFEDKNGFVDVKGYTKNWIQCSADPTPASWVNIDDLTDSGLDYDTPDSSDFGNFLS